MKLIKLNSYLLKISLSLFAISMFVSQLKAGFMDNPNQKIYNDSWAVIIGINKYQNLNRLNYAVDDAQDIYNLLNNKFNFPENNIRLLLDENATRENILTQLYETAQKVGSNDRLLVFFAGHGTQIDLPSGGEKGFLIPVDGNQSNLFMTGIDMQEIKSISDITPAKHVLYLMDACYGGLMAVRSQGLAPETPGYIDKITKDKARQIITAGGRDEEVQERPEWGHSAFTKNIIRGLKDEMSDLNNDGFITADELGVYLSDKVTIDSENMQTPQNQRYGSGEGQFVFRGTPTALDVVIPDINKSIEPSPRESDPLTTKDLQRALSIIFANQITPKQVNSSSEITNFKAGKMVAEKWELMFGETGHINATKVDGKWLELISSPYFGFNRVDGVRVGAIKSITRTNPFAYNLGIKGWYNFSRKSPDFTLNFKRYLWNREYHTLNTSIYRNATTYDEWSVLSDFTHLYGSAFFFNVDHFDYFLREGISLFHEYYNRDGFSTHVGYTNEKQKTVSKTTDFSVFRYKKEYRENYFSTEDYFNEGTLSNVKIELGFNGASPDFNFADYYQGNEISYELDPRNIPLEYSLNNYNIINISSSTLGVPDSLVNDSLSSSLDAFKDGWNSAGSSFQHPQNEDIRNAMSKYVESQAKKTNGYFEVQDVDLGVVRKLKLIRVHDRVGKTGDYYYSCADFEDINGGDTLDLDIDVSYEDGSLEVADVRIHKLAGVARYTYDENDNRIPLGKTKSHLGKDSTSAEKEHGGKEHGGKEHVKLNAYISQIDSISVGIQSIEYRANTPGGDSSGVRFFGMGPMGKYPSLVFLDSARVKRGKTYIFSFWVRSLKDTLSISPGISTHDHDGLSIKTWGEIGIKWKRIWVRKTFDEVGDNPRTYISTSEIKPIYVWGVQLEEVFSDNDEPTEYLPTEGNSMEIWLTGESSNWYYDKLLLTNEDNELFYNKPFMARGKYAYRFTIGNHFFLDPNAEIQGKSKTGEDVSILRVGLKPKWNISFEYSDPVIGSDFNYFRISSNLRFILPLSYNENLYFRIVNGWVTSNAPKQRLYYLGNVGTLRGYNVKELSGENLLLLNMEYHVNILKWVYPLDGKSENIDEGMNLPGLWEGERLIVPNLRPFLFYDMGIIGNELNRENSYFSAGVGLEFIGLRMMVAKRLDRNENAWSFLLDFGGFFNRWEYLP